MLAPFESAKLLIRRAEKHANEFEAIYNAYFAKNPYVTFVEANRYTGEQIFKVRLKQSIPVELAVVAFDIVNNLRAALDHAVFDGSKVVGGPPSPKYTKFPFGIDATAAANDLPRKHSEVPECLRPYLLSFKPYKDGGNGLWELNELRNHKVHVILRPGAMTSQGMGFRQGYIHVMRFETISEWDEAKQELSYLKVAPGASYDNLQISTRVCITIGEGGMASHPATEIFRNLRVCPERSYWITKFSEHETD